MKNLDNFFRPENIAVIGASQNPDKVGHVIFRNLIDGWGSRVFPVNPNAEFVLNRISYKNVNDIKEKIDLAVIAIPSKFIPQAIKDCASKKIKNVVIISAGFEEIGNIKLAGQVKSMLDKYKIDVIGPNVLGILDCHTKLDCLFVPKYRMQRPKPGGIAFVSQSGALGTAMLDMVSSKDIGFSKFISYGNAMNVDESDIIEYLVDDSNTKVICLYIEGIKDGRKFIEVCKAAAKKKPIIVIKGGKTDEGNKAALSHTGSLAGSAEIYDGIFKQCGIITADTLDDMFDYALALDKCAAPKGKNVMILTDGGGLGIVTADEVVGKGLALANLGKNSITLLRKLMPQIILIRNPLDLLGDSNTERYDKALAVIMNDNNVDIVLVVLLFQLPLINKDVVGAIANYNNLRKKPILVISPGGNYVKNINKEFMSNNVPCYDSPYAAAKAAKALVGCLKENK